jgi:hypothetical protein
MADARHRFVPTQEAAVRPARAAARRSGSGWFVGAAVLAAGVVLLPSFRAKGDPDARARFSAHRAQFQLLKDMMLNEPSVTSVGPDNVREFWFFDRRWSSPRQPGRSMNRAEMLEAAGLAPERYDAYLELLKSVGGYRAVRSGAARSRRVTIHIFPSKETGGPSAQVVWNAASAKPSVTGEPLGDGWSLEFDGN